MDYCSGVALWVGDGTTHWNLDIHEGQVSYVSTPLWTAHAFMAMNTTEAYHYYQMIYDPAADRVHVYVDGLPAGDLLRSQLASTSSNLWTGFGANSSRDTSSANWNYVAYEVGQHVVPEPSVLLLLALGGMALLRRRSRR